MLPINHPGANQIYQPLVLIQLTALALSTMTTLIDED